MCSKVGYSRSLVFEVLPNLRSLDGRDEFGRNVLAIFHKDFHEVNKYADILSDDSDSEPLMERQMNSQRSRILRPSQADNRNPTSAAASKQKEARFAKLENQMMTLLRTAGANLAPPSPGAKDHSENQDKLNSLEKQLIELRATILPTLTTGQTMPAAATDRIQQLEAKLHEAEEALKAETRAKGLVFESDERGQDQRSENRSEFQKDVRQSRPQRKQGKRQIFNAWRQDATFDDEQRDEERSQSEAGWMPPTKIPKAADSKRRALVWKEQTERDDPDDENTAPVRRPSQTVSSTALFDAGQRQNRAATSATLAANAKLIAALESEEKRLRENESKYAEQIKELAEKAANVEERAKQAELRNEELQKQHENDLATMTSFKERVEKTEPELETTRCRLHDLEITHVETTSKLTSALESISQLQTQNGQLAEITKRLSEELRQRDEDLKLIHGSLGEAEIALEDMDQQIHGYEEERSHLQSCMTKEREQLRVKLAETKRETEIYKSTIKQLQKEVCSLQEKLSAQDMQGRQKAQEMFSNHINEMNSLVSMTTERLVERHRGEMDTMSKTVEHIKNAYAKLEKEHEKATKSEQARFRDMQGALETASKRSMEQAQMLKAATQKEKELDSMIRELNVVVREQQAKIADLETKSQVSYTIYEERSQQLQESSDEITALRSELQAIQRELADAEATCFAKENAVQQWQSECQTLRDQLTAKEQEKVQAEAKVRQGAEEVAKAIKIRNDAEQALRVKVKMLEDQNETIRTLKGNLDNKNREYQILISERSKGEQTLEEQIELERATVKELQLELDAHAEAIEELRSRMQGYKDERDELRREIVDISKKLKDRNDSIERIEEEVARVRKVFKAKEEKLLQEKADALKARDNETVELRQAFETQSARMSMVDQERDAFTQKIKALQWELETANDEKEQLASDLRMIRIDRDKEKHRMEERLAKVKAAFSDL
ncbi:hypothetical protein HK097_011180 [Rhizophlyctis rosea]|uniref:Uncharacterized protein n=1 Tax=Rhizophlyctis rosea TaxID=64517 RepID=A0AAD5SN26_9FUNG|nr:hypothetical protein HK097_011180 [Rhizophlyctis rosea]